jgi:hypothetical protein
MRLLLQPIPDDTGGYETFGYFKLEGSGSIHLSYRSSRCNNKRISLAMQSRVAVIYPTSSYIKPFRYSVSGIMGIIGWSGDCE